MGDNKTWVFATVVLAIFLGIAYPALADRQITHSISGNHTVDYTHDAATDVVIREGWYKDGKPDRADGPAQIIRDLATGTVTYEAWYKAGKVSRIGGPAYILRA